MERLDAQTKYIEVERINPRTKALEKVFRVANPNIEKGDAVSGDEIHDFEMPKGDPFRGNFGKFSLT